MKDKIMDGLAEVRSKISIYKDFLATAKEEILMINMKRIFILSHIYILLSLIHIIIFTTCKIYQSGIELIWKNSTIKIHTILIILLLVFTLFSFLLSKKKRVMKYLPVKQIMINLAVITTIYTGIIETVMDQYITVSITPFLISCTIVSSLMIMNPLHSLILFILTYFVFDHAMGMVLTNQLLRLSNRGKAITVISISYCLSIVLWNYYRKNYNQTRHIAEQRFALEVKNKELAESNVIKDKLFSIITHDIRQPLASILNLTELIEEINHLDPEYYEMVNHVKKQMTDSFSMIDKLFDWCRNQKGGFSYHPEVINLGKLMNENLDITRPNAVMKEVTIVNEIELETSTDLYAYADREMINLVVRNVLSNAVKFSHRGGWIHIRAKKSMNEIILEVNDSGVGIDGTRISKLFDAKEIMLSTNGTEGEKGTGLGLHLSVEFIQKNNGNMWVESTVGKGSTFYVSIPTENISDKSKAIGKDD